MAKRYFFSAKKKYNYEMLYLCLLHAHVCIAHFLYQKGQIWIKFGKLIPELRGHKAILFQRYRDRLFNLEPIPISTCQ